MSRYATWGIILDDIIYPNGRTAMAQLGGGGLYAACGMRLWHDDVTLNAAVGADFDPRCLKPHGFDDRGLVVTDLPTPRAWQVLEEDGRRTQVPRVSAEAWFDQLVHVPAAQPISPTLKGFHFFGRGDALEEQFVQALVAANVFLSAELIVDEDTTSVEIAIFKRCLPFFTIFSPGEPDAQVLVGERPPKEQLRALAALGPRLVALRRGKAGSLIYDREADLFLRVPAFPAKVVDVTGAGNAFCGGLLVGWLETYDLRQAAAQAAVSAALTIAQIGPPVIDEAVQRLARQRAAEAMRLIEEV
ncbi:MAG: hypothetical protein H6654_18050 [Ardenticatenaceae bacterium]|nr:hypothetical protein [Ardenticatenaceae bacterium]MCB8975467.1 hypothetical protein [Ardenticatenaceae bacterium]